MAVDIATRIANATMRHAVFIERLENGTLKRVLTALLQSQREILRLIRANYEGIPSGTDELQALSPVQLARLDAISQQIESILRVSRELTDELIRGDLTDFANAEGQMLVDIINRQIPPSLELQLRFDRLPLGSIERMVNTPLGGEIFAERLLRNYGDAVGRIKATLTDALIQGETIQQAVKRVTAIIGDSLINRAEVLVRTEFARVATLANMNAMRQNSDVIKGFIWVSSLDLRVCPICRKLHGKKLPLNTNEHPPAHPRCRCVLISELKTAADLGITDRDIPDDLKALFTDRPPDIPLDFDAWLRGQSSGFQEQALGGKRYEMFKQGVSVKDMPPDMRELTIGEFQELSATV